MALCKVVLFEKAILCSKMLMYVTKLYLVIFSSAMPVLTRLVLDWCIKYGKTRDLETVCYSLAGNPDCDYKVIIFEIELTKSMLARKAFDLFFKGQKGYCKACGLY